MILKLPKYSLGNHHISGKQAGAQKYKSAQKIIEIVFPDEDVDLPDNTS